MLALFTILHRLVVESSPDACAATIRHDLCVLEAQMAQVKEQLERLKTDFDAAMARVAADTDNFKAGLAAANAKIAELEAQIGEASPEVQTLLDELKTVVNGLDPDPAFPATEPPVEPPVEPEPGV